MKSWGRERKGFDNLILAPSVCLLRKCLVSGRNDTCKVVISARFSAFFAPCDFEKRALRDAAELPSAMRSTEKCLLEVASSSTLPCTHPVVISVTRDGLAFA